MNPNRFPRDGLRVTVDTWLTHRQAQCLKLLAEGFCNKEIAEKLRVSDMQVKALLVEIRLRLAMPWSNRITLARWAYSKGLAKPY